MNKENQNIINSIPEREQMEIALVNQFLKEE